MRKVIFILALTACFPLWLSGQGMLNDTTKSIYYWRITERTGEIIEGRPDTLLTDFPNRLHVEGQSISMAYLGNLGLPMESRIFFERPDRSNFMFTDPYFNYMKIPGRHNFVSTKIPYSNLTYQTAGSRQSKEERLMGGLAVNFGKHLNIGLDVDYLYARGFYSAQSAKHTDWDFYGSYITDKHVLHAFVAPSSYTNAENGGIINDTYITDPASIGFPKIQPRDIPVNFESPSDGAILWNRTKGARYYLNYHYNLGFEKETEAVDKEGNQITEFVPVSSIIYTFDYTDRKRSFNTSDSATLDNFYKNRDYFGDGRKLNDSTSYSALRNTLGISLREGFSKWAKFDLTAFITQDVNSYTLMSRDTLTKKVNKIPNDYNQYTTYIGGEVAKRTGKILRYNAQGEVGVLGGGNYNKNMGDFKVSGNIETRIPLFKDTAAVIATGSIKNLAPAFYETNFHGKYFWWDDNNFKKVQKTYLGGTIDIPHTKTNFNLGAENISDYIYFDETGYPKQHSEKIQILAATLKQNVKLGGLHWDNQVVYQTSSDQKIIPLPDLCVYSSLYFQFLVSKVLTIQLGGNVHYFTKYDAPTYEPATQQFKLQHETKIGEYPLVNAFVNCHLKYTRFFVEFYNISSSFVQSPAYFSMPHYPVNPQLFKVGLSWDFHN